MYEAPNPAEFVRLAKCISAGRGNRADIIRAAETQRASDRVMSVLKAPTPSASLADPEFAGTLASYSQISRAFVDSVRDRSLFYRLASLAIPSPLFDRAVATVMIEDDMGERAEGTWLPVLRFALNDTPLRPIETGAIVVVTQELARATDRESFAALRLELERAAIASVDRRFWALIEAEGLIVPTTTGGTKTHPAVAVERDSRIAFARLLRELDLDADASADRSRPPALRSNRPGYRN